MAPARMTCTTNSAEPLVAVARMAVSGSRRTSRSTVAAGPASPLAAAVGTSTIMMSGRLLGALSAASVASSYSPTRAIDGTPARALRMDARVSRSASTMTVLIVVPDITCAAPRGWGCSCRTAGPAPTPPPPLPQPRSAGLQRDPLALRLTLLHELEGVRDAGRADRRWLHQLHGHQ